MKKIIIFFVLFLFPAGLCGAQAPDTQQGLTQEIPKNLGRFTVSPAHPNIKSPSGFYVEMRPGETYEDTAVIKNDNDYEIKLTLFAGDGMTLPDGAWTAQDQDQEQKLVGKWIQMSENEIILGPNEQKEVKFKITIPDDTPYDKYLGGICAVSGRTTPTINGMTPTVKGGIAYAVRYVQHVIIIVTDNPQHIPKVGEINVFESGTPYFWGSVALFIFGMGYLVWGTINERKKKKQLTNKS